MEGHEYGCAGHCLNAALDHFRHNNFVSPVPDEMSVTDICKELNARSFSFLLAPPSLSLIRLKYLKLSVGKTAMVRSFRSIRGTAALFVIGSSYELYGVSEPWLHTIVFLISPSKKCTIYDPYDSFVSDEARACLGRKGPIELIRNKWTATVLVWSEPR